MEIRRSLRKDALSTAILTASILFSPVGALAGPKEIVQPIQVENATDGSLDVIVGNPVTLHGPVGVMGEVEVKNDSGTPLPVALPDNVVQIDDDDPVDVRVSPRTRSYSLSRAVLSQTGSNVVISSVAVPFDSYIAGVTFIAEGDGIVACKATLSYESSDVRPGGANTNAIARAAFQSANGSNVDSSRHTPIPNMFVGQNVELDLRGSSVNVIPDYDCLVTALIHLIPADTGITPGLSLP